MQEPEILNVVTKVIELRDAIKKVDGWKQRYILRALIVKTLFDKDVTFHDLQDGIHQALEVR